MLYIPRLLACCTFITTKDNRELGPSSIRFRACRLALPSSPLDEELVWIMLDRLVIKHPEVAGT
jgi:hypothetical protein